MTHGGAFIGRTDAVGTVMNPGPWQVFLAGQTAYCPAASTDPNRKECGRRLRDVGHGLRFMVRVRAYQGLDKPMKGTTTQSCPKCGVILECKEEQV